MARRRTATYDEIDPKFGEPLSNVTMDGFLSSSYPGAAPPPRLRPEPPRAPLRKPSDVSWEVPPLELPTAPKKRSLSDSQTTTEEFSLLEENEEEEEEEAMTFALDGGVEDDDDEPDAFQLAGFEDDDDVGGFVASEVIPKGKVLSFGYSNSTREERMKVSSSLPAPTMKHMASEQMGRARTESVNTPLGASPILLSVLEQVAAAQASSASQPVGRFRADSC